MELPGADPDCPWCHGPTEALQVLPLPGGIIVSGVPKAKNPFAAALGRLGAKKGGVARARAQPEAAPRDRTHRGAGALGEGWQEAVSRQRLLRCSEENRHQPAPLLASTWA